MREETTASARSIRQPPENCRNCGGKLTGKYCAYCGQKDSVRDLRFSDLIGELARDLFAWDSRVWRTLIPLLIRPGFLTAEFIDGRKARYLPPVRLYLVISFFMFLFISFSSQDGVVSFDPDLTPEEKEQAIAKMEQKLQESDMSDEKKQAAREHTLKHLEKGIVAELDAINPDSETSSIDGSEAELDFWEEGEKPAWASELEERFTRNAKSIEQDPDLFVEDFVERMPYMMFLLLPLFALLVHCVYLFSPFHYLQHLVFSLHVHSAVFLLVTMGMAMDALFDVAAGALILLWCSAYLPLALVRVYGSGYWAACGKSLLIGLGEMILLIFTLSALAIFSVAAL